MYVKKKKSVYSNPTWVTGYRYHNLDKYIASKCLHYVCIISTSIVILRWNNPETKKNSKIKVTAWFRNLNLDHIKVFALYQHQFYISMISMQDLNMSCCCINGYNIVTEWTKIHVYLLSCLHLDWNLVGIIVKSRSHGRLGYKDR